MLFIFKDDGANECDSAGTDKRPDSAYTTDNASSSLSNNRTTASRNHKGTSIHDVRTVGGEGG